MRDVSASYSECDSSYLVLECSDVYANHVACLLRVRLIRRRGGVSRPLTKHQRVADMEGLECCQDRIGLEIMASTTSLRARVSHCPFDFTRDGTRISCSVGTRIAHVPYWDCWRGMVCVCGMWHIRTCRTRYYVGCAYQSITEIEMTDTTTPRSEISRGNS